MKAIEIGGVSDHVHLLLSLPSTLSIAKALQLVPRGSPSEDDISGGVPGFA
jgi:REP element-mobilizing transposase RayT